jgi:transposase
VSEVTTIGLDIAKHVFHAHGADERGAMVFSRKLTRGKLLDFFAKHPRCVVHWRHAAVRITGLASSRRWAMRSG